MSEIGYLFCKKLLENYIMVLDQVFARRFNNRSYSFVGTKFVVVFNNEPDLLGTGFRGSPVNLGQMKVFDISC